MKNLVISICVLLLLILLAISYGFQQERHVVDYSEDSKKDITNETNVRSSFLDSSCLSTEEAADNNVTLDLPERILHRKGYTVSYNPKLLIPNWVAWNLTAEHVDGDWPRDNMYYEDEDVPQPRATNEDYHRSGWSRGHMCPAGDNKWDSVAMSESNLLTNICPQHSGLNSGLWNVIERDCRRWAKKYESIFIVCGPVLLNGEHVTIGNNKVIVPEAFFKVILRMNPQPTAIGFVVRNNEGTKKRDNYINTVDEVERITGIDFFSDLPDDIENKVEANSNIEDWK